MQQNSPLLFLLSDQHRTLSIRCGDLLLWEFRTPSLFALLPNAGFILLILTLKKCTLTYSDRHLGEKCNYTSQPRRPKLWLYLICRPTGCWSLVSFHTALVKSLWSAQFHSWWQINTDTPHLSFKANNCSCIASAGFWSNAMKGVVWVLVQT